MDLKYKYIFASNAAISCKNTDPNYNQYFNHLSHVHECLMMTVLYGRNM
jgi:hypothetical protein